MAESKAQKATVERVMHEWKTGELKTPAGDPVTDRRQAIAIGLSEAGASDRVDAAQNRRNLRRTKAEEREGRTGRDRAEGDGPSRAELYAEARRRDVPNRSRMTKAQLQAALKG